MMSLIYFPGHIPVIQIIFKYKTFNNITFIDQQYIHRTVHDTNRSNKLKDNHKFTKKYPPTSNNLSITRELLRDY